MTSSDYNAFGKDPHGFKAHCFALVFGPEFVPDSFDHLPRFQGPVLPPRYGPPSPQQAEWLHPDWKPNDPPAYYRTPFPPYLPKPRAFNPGLFDALERESRAVPRGVKYGGIDLRSLVKVVAFPVVVTYTSGDATGYFRVFTDMRWDEFLKELRAQIGNYLYTRGPWAYRQFHFLVSDDEPYDNSLGRYGRVRPLACAKDWEEAVVSLRSTGQELALQIDVFRATADTIAFLNRKKDALCLPVDGLQVKTYYFDYPPVEALLDLLGGSLEARLVEFEGRHRIGDLLRRAGLESVECFTRLSPRSLHTAEGVPIDAIRLLYAGAEEMIRATHRGLENEVLDINEMLGI